MNFKVAGGIIGELSEKIPSNLVALNEIIKNSYDAGANNVTLTFNTSDKTFTIADDGFGMDRKGIEELLHISKSSKKYGIFNEKTNRYIQGSKGLGILSVFKFGSMVSFSTVKDTKCMEFTLDFDVLSKLDDVSKYEVRVEEKDVDNTPSGTSITITLGAEQNLDLIKQYFNDERNRDKLLNSFLDNTFTIILEIDGKRFQTQQVNLEAYYPNKKTFNIKYDSTNGKVSFVDKNATTHTFDYAFDNSKDVKVEIDILAFDFTGGRGKDIDQLFLAPKEENKLTPLIYINNNLFNNYELFDPDIMRRKKGGQALAQLIGHIKIYSSDKNMEFNSDRTNFQENELTTYLTDFLTGINEFIQKEGQKIKRAAKNNEEQPKNDEKADDKQAGKGADKGCEEDDPGTNDEDANNDNTSPNEGANQQLKDSEPIKIAQPTEYLIPTIGNYTCSFTNAAIGKLSSQINHLSGLKNKDYKEVLACSLRAVFELCIDELESANRVSFQERGIEKKVPALVDHVKNTNGTLTIIANTISCGYQNLGNELKGYDYGRVMSLCHLGAHKSSTSLTQNHIDEIGIALSRFIPIASVILNDSTISPISL